MILKNVSDTIYADSLTLFAHFDFDLTCDVTGDPEGITICFPITVFPGLSNTA